MMAVDSGVADGDMAEGCADAVVDATVGGNSTRFMSHSCEPNCTIYEMEHGTALVLEIFAVKEIRSGSEITYDYSFSEGGKIHFRCGNWRCRGLV